jgi:hypothetical protein
MICAIPENSILGINNIALKKDMTQSDKKCFVCEHIFKEEKVELNNVVNLFVCHECKDTEHEKQKETELL